MGRFFDRVLMLDSDEPKLSELICKSAETIGYYPGEEGKGVPFSVKQCAGSQWLDLASPILEDDETTSSRFMKELSRHVRTAVLSIECVDSDFAVLRLFDEPDHIQTTACINKPYSGLCFGEPDYSVWAAICKKWQCKPDQFKDVFEANYAFAEDGIALLAALLHIVPADPEELNTEEEITLWFRSENPIAQPIPLPRPMVERLPEYIEREYAGKLRTAGYRCYHNNLDRWHKIVGEPGNEVLLSIVFVIDRGGYDLVPFYGAQSVYCPLVLSNKYYPLHDDHDYWKEAKFEFPRKLGWDPLKDETGGITIWRSLEPERLSLYMDELMLPELAQITDFTSCHAAFLQEMKKPHASEFGIYRSWLEAVLNGDEKEAHSWYRRWKGSITKSNNKRFWNKEIELNMLKVYESGGCDALVAYLRETVYRDNMKKLKRAGIV